MQSCWRRRICDGPRGAVAAAGLAACALGVACSDAPAPRFGANVILFSIDTLRADHLGCYGYERPTSPTIDELSSDAILFRVAIAHAPSTLASHASIFTSQVPQHHGASFARLTALPPDAVGLATVLKASGYHTASFNGGGQLSAEFGLDQGFEEYRSFPGAQGRFDRVLPRVLAWLGQARVRPFFLFLHTYGVHASYRPQPGYLALFRGPYDGPLPERISQLLLNRINSGQLPVDAADRQHIVAAYDAEIRWVDEHLGQLVQHLKGTGLYNDTLIAVTSDHGEELGERGRIGLHSHTLYDELLRVPLVVKLPHARHAGVRVDVPVRSIDIAPTILGALGIPAPATFDGEDLLARLGGTRAAPPAVCWLDAPSPADGTALRTAEWKLDRGRLYDLVRDPGETRDLAAQRGNVVAALERQRDAILAARPLPSAQRVQPSKELQEQLHALGYVK